MENSNVIINNSRSCKDANINTKCCCSSLHGNNNNIHIILENPQNKEMSVSVSTKNEKTLISITTKNKEITNHVLTKNENEYYCKYCQIGNCVKREKEHLKIIHRQLTDDEKDTYLRVWHWRLAISGDYERNYKKAFDDLAENKFIKKSETRSKFSYLKDKNCGLLSIVMDIIIKGELLILNPQLVYILKDENTNDIYHASWCKTCMGAKNIQCPSYEILNGNFEPSFKYHEFGVQMCLSVTMSKVGLKIHSPSYITKGTRELKKIADSKLAKEYANNYLSASSELDYRETPFAKSFPTEILDIHWNMTKPSIQNIYDDKIKDSS